MASAPAAESGGFLGTTLPAIDDEEGARLPTQLPPVIDAHVHVFPDRLFAAIWQWFDQWGWPIRYRLTAREALRFQLERGVARVVALTYAHKPGLARSLNHFVAELAAEEPRMIGLATVYPGEDDARAIVEEAFALGLAGVKMHCHVQCFSPDDPALNVVYETCARHGRPLVIHAGREPKSPGYKCDPHALCAAERIERVLQNHPTLKLCVPHLGADEYDAYARLLERHDTLWLDTTMTLAEYFPGPAPHHVLHVRPERILYGTDFPNLPFAWDREVTRLARLGLSEAHLAAVLGQNAASLFGGTLV